jgi:hypothetical protein
MVDPRAFDSRAGYAVISSREEITMPAIASEMLAAFKLANDYFLGSPWTAIVADFPDQAAADTFRQQVQQYANDNGLTATFSYGGRTSVVFRYDNR